MSLLLLLLLLLPPPPPPPLLLLPPPPPLPLCVFGGSQASQWKVEEDCFIYGRPVYYGMMTAAFTPLEEAQVPKV
jgi:hypothetical protein